MSPFVHQVPITWRCTCSRRDKSMIMYFRAGAIVRADRHPCCACSTSGRGEARAGPLVETTIGDESAKSHCRAEVSRARSSTTTILRWLRRSGRWYRPRSGCTGSIRCQSTPIREDSRQSGDDEARRARPRTAGGLRLPGRVGRLILSRGCLGVGGRCRRVTGNGVVRGGVGGRCRRVTSPCSRIPTALAPILPILAPTLLLFGAQGTETNYTAVHLAVAALALVGGVIISTRVHSAR